jgi:hypothetical protein
MVAPRRPGRWYRFFGKPGECLESQCLESYGINYVFRLEERLLLRGNHPQGQQRIHLAIQVVSFAAARSGDRNAKGRAGVMEQLLNYARVHHTPDAGEQRLH